MEKELKPIPAFKDHSNCSGHANWMLDCEYTKPEEREILVKAIENYTAK